MKKWMVVIGCALVVLMVGTVVAAWEGEAEEDEYEGITEEIWCELTACTGDDAMNDDVTDDEGFYPLSAPVAWGCCEYAKLADGTYRCHCTEPVPGLGLPVTATAFYVGRTSEVDPTYDLIAVKGMRVSGVWSYSVCGGCEKQDDCRVLVWGIDSAAYGTDYLTLVDANVTYGDGSFTTWWASYWTSVTVAGLAGVDQITGSRQSDWLFGGTGDDRIYGLTGNDTLWGVEDDDTLYGGDNNDSLYGGIGDDSLWGGYGSDFLHGGDEVSGDYCNCEGSSDPAAWDCEGTVYNCDD